LEIPNHSDMMVLVVLVNTILPVMGLNQWP